jgi:Lipase maturation factor
MPRRASSICRWFLDGKRGPVPGSLAARWLFLRALGLIFFSAFYSLFFQIRGLIGPDGLLPAGMYLGEVARALSLPAAPGWVRYWFAPTVLWFGASDRALLALCWVGMAASVLLVLNCWPRGTTLVCLIAFLSFVAAAQDFSDYQSDGMLLAAGFLALFFAPAGLRPGWGEATPPSRASLYLLRWEWFRIYFESGIAKMAGHDPEWRNFTAMDHYYQNSPLPSWLGWYAEHLPHWFHAATVGATLSLELGLVWLLFFPRRFRIGLFFFTACLQIGILLTSNYAFLNFISLALSLLLLDDRFLHRLLPAKARQAEQARAAALAAAAEAEGAGEWTALELGGEAPAAPRVPATAPVARPASWFARARERLPAIRLWASGIFLGWVFYDTLALLLAMVAPALALPAAPVAALEPFRIANQYGLFGVMTRGRYEIEFQGSRDGRTWVPYPFRYKPQDPSRPPRIYAPYQPRFDWNLWFASLGSWRQYPFVLRTEELLLKNDPAVLSLFAGNPFPRSPPRAVRAVIWQYWFTDAATKREKGLWWRRQLLGLYAPTLEREPDGRFGVLAMPGVQLLPSPP